VFKYDFINLTGIWKQSLVGKQATPFFALTTYSNPVALGALLGNYLGNGYQTLSMSVVDDVGISLHYFSFNVFTDYMPQGTVPATTSLALILLFLIVSVYY